MEIITIILLLAILYLVVSGKSELNNKLTDMELHIQDLREALKKAIVDKPAAKPETPLITQMPPIPHTRPDTPRPQPAETPGLADKVIDAPREQPYSETITPPKHIPDDIRKQPVKQFEPVDYRVEQEPQPSFFERYPDLEKFIGENLINKIGIAILVLAIGYFVKYAIDNNWIGPVGRVGIGILCGSILIGFAHKLRTNYKAFSSVLAGGGLAIYYFTITLAFHQFNLFSQTVAFIILIVITLFAVALSLLYDKQELAVIALVGGLASPFMISNGQANYNAFFIYLVIINAGLLVIAYYKDWRILNISSFGLTVIVYAGAVFAMPVANYSTAFIFGSIFYLLFLAINIAHNVREGKAFLASDYSILLINTGLYFGAGLFLLTEMHQEAYRGLFCGGLATINLALSYILFKNKKVDTNVLYLLIGITLTFISLMAPIQLHGHYITLFWASETVLLYWLFQKSGIGLMKVTSILVWALMLVSLGIDWIHVYGNTAFIGPVIINKGFITTVCAAVGTYLLFILVNKDEDQHQDSWAIPAQVLQGAAFIILFLSGVLEINHQFLSRYPNTDLNMLYLMLYVPAFVWLFNLLVMSKKAQDVNPYVRTGIIAAAIVTYLVVIQDSFNTQRLMLEQHKPAGLHFITHWIAAIFIGLLFYKLIQVIKDELTLPDAATWIICAGIVTFLSLEVCLASNWLFTSASTTFDRVETVYIKTGLPVLWGLSSFAIMWLGMRHKERPLRIISLSLFTLTLAKLFIFDIRDIPAAGKIAAFFCLGVLLLIVSFMYQKVKKIIVADETPEQDS